MQREGSAFQGLGVVMLKELSDHLTSVRMRVLEWLIVLVALAALYGEDKIFRSRIVMSRHGFGRGASLLLSKYRV